MSKKTKWQSPFTKGQLVVAVEGLTDVPRDQRGTLKRIWLQEGVWVADVKWHGGGVSSALDCTSLRSPVGDALHGTPPSEYPLPPLPPLDETALAANAANRLRNNPHLPEELEENAQQAIANVGEVLDAIDAPQAPTFAQRIQRLYREFREKLEVAGIQHRIDRGRQVDAERAHNLLDGWEIPRTGPDDGDLDPTPEEAGAKLTPYQRVRELTERLKRAEARPFDQPRCPTSGDVLKEQRREFEEKLAAEPISSDLAALRIRSRDDAWVSEVAYQAAGAATRPLLEDHPDYTFPADRVRDAVAELLAEFDIGPRSADRAEEDFEHGRKEVEPPTEAEEATGPRDTIPPDEFDIAALACERLYERLANGPLPNPAELARVIDILR